MESGLLRTQGGHVVFKTRGETRDGHAAISGVYLKNI